MLAHSLYHIEQIEWILFTFAQFVQFAIANFVSFYDTKFALTHFVGGGMQHGPPWSHLADFGQSANLTLEKCHQQGLKLAFLHWIRFNKDNKKLKMDQKGQNMYEKGLKIEFLDQKYLVFSGIGGSPPPPLDGKYFCNFSLAEKGSTPIR